MPLIEPVARCRKFNSLPRDAQWFYLQLKTILDPAGRHEADHDILNSTLFPLRKDIRNTYISRWLAECHKAGLLHCYVDTQGRPIVEVFDARQTAMKFAKSKFDPPEGQMPLLSESAPKPAVKRNEMKRREENPPARFLDVKSKIINPPSPDSAEDARKMLESKVNDLLSSAMSTASSADALKTLEFKMNELYRREATDAWTYAELSALAEAARRPASLDEFEHMMELRRSMPPDDRKRFFPQSVYSFLSKWTETLDKARIQCPRRRRCATDDHKSAGHSSASAVRGDSHPQSSTAEEAILRQSIEYLEKNHPHSPMLETQKKQLAKLTSKP